MKKQKLLLLALFALVIICANATRYIAVKIGDEFTVYTAKDSPKQEKNYWNQNVEIKISKFKTPSSLNYEIINIPKEDFEAFSKDVNGIYDSDLERVETDLEKVETELKDARHNNLVLAAKNHQLNQGIKKEKNIQLCLTVSLVVAIIVIVAMAIREFRAKKYAFYEY
jgi:hypothetical protein